MRIGDKKPFLREEGGFTLPEVLVTIMMMVMVLFALYSIFDMGIRVFAFGNDKLEATENARLGLEKMDREIRAAFPHDATDNHLFFDASAPDTSDMPPTMPTEADPLTFGNELGSPGNGEIDSNEVISYYQKNDLLMRQTGGSTAQPVIGSLSANAFELTYCENVADCPPATAITTESDVKIAQISLTVVEGDSTQTLTTDVALRNRSNP